jgi:excisionase family DNA binding protein
MSTSLRDAETAKRPIARGIRETAEILGVSPSFVRKEIEAGNLRRTRLGRRVLVKDADLLEWLNRNDDPRTEAAQGGANGDTR